MDSDKYPKGLICICGESITFKYERFDDERDKVVCNTCGTVYLPQYTGATHTPVYRRVGEDGYIDFEGEVIY